MEIDVTLDIEEGDILIFNNKEWRVVNLDTGTFDLKPVVGQSQNFSPKELQEYIDFSGEFTVIKSEYADI